MYPVVHRILKAIFTRYFDWGTSGKENIPATGSAIVVSNHVNYLDPMAMGALSPRALHFMAKEELFSNPVAGWILRKLGAFPVRRGRGDRRAIRHALQLLEEGKVLAMFPEGTRSETGELMELQRGAALLALKSGAPVVPMVIQGAYEALDGGRKIPRRGVRVRVRVGPPLRVEALKRVDQAAVADLSESIHQVMETLYEDG